MKRWGGNSLGGRGRGTGLNNWQITLEQYDQFLIVEEIKKESELIRESGEVDSGGIVSPTIYKRCYCCKNFTLPINTTYETCPICGWIDDEYQNKHPDSLEGMNEISLRDARERYEG